MKMFLSVLLASALATGFVVGCSGEESRSGQGGGTAWSKHYEGITPRGNMNLASDGNTTCVSVSGYSRCTGE